MFLSFYFFLDCFHIAVFFFLFHVNIDSRTKAAKLISIDMYVYMAAFRGSSGAQGHVQSNVIGMYKENLCGFVSFWTNVFFCI